MLLTTTCVEEHWNRRYHNLRNSTPLVLLGIDVFGAQKFHSLNINNDIDANASGGKHKLTTVMSAIIELTEPTSVSLHRFTSNPELPLCFVWITLIIIYAVCWKYRRDRAPCLLTRHPPRQRESLSASGEPDTEC
uniref:Uncharacterized protein n=1 Tax=Echinococcus granulosus TaxID=6210 RepID=A0A068WXX5_ECHGR|nr:hypothetical protein EgrG_002048800 [Echinococcus granulosus]